MPNFVCKELSILFHSFQIKAVQQKCSNGDLTKKKNFGLFLAQQQPFQVRFVSDSFEFVSETSFNPNGFRLQYEMLTCGPL